MRNTNRITFFCLLISLALFGCKKERTINLDVTVVDGVSNQPVKGALVGLKYKDYTNYGKADPMEKETWFGATDNNGNYSYKHIMERKTGNYSLFVSAGRDYSHCMSPDYSLGENISTGKKVKKTIKLIRYYHYLLSLENTNCFDQTDTVWVSIPNDEYGHYNVWAGCSPTTIHLGGYNNLTFSSMKSMVTFHVKVKRNGVITEFDQPETLQFGSITPVQINY